MSDYGVEVGEVSNSVEETSESQVQEISEQIAEALGHPDDYGDVWT